MNGDSFASVKLYHASGAQVTFSWTTGANGVISDTNAANANVSLANLLAAGFTVSLPGLEAGQHIEQIGAVSRREKSDGIPIVDLFSVNELAEFKVFSLYLNNADEISEFERVTGLELTRIPLNDGDAAVNRKSKNAGKYIIPVQRAVEIILSDNPKYNPDEPDLTKRKAKYKFAGWKGSAPAPDKDEHTDPPKAWNTPDMEAKFIASMFKRYEASAEEVNKALLAYDNAQMPMTDWRTSINLAAAAVVAYIAMGSAAHIRKLVNAQTDYTPEQRKALIDAAEMVTQACGATIS